MIREAAGDESLSGRCHGDDRGDADVPDVSSESDGTTLQKGRKLLMMIRSTYAAVINIIIITKIIIIIINYKLLNADILLVPLLSSIRSFSVIIKVSFLILLFSFHEFNVTIMSVII